MTESDIDNETEIALLFHDGPEELGDLMAVAFSAGWSLDASLHMRDGRLNLQIRGVAPSPGLDDVQVAAVFEHCIWSVDDQATGFVSVVGTVEPRGVRALQKYVLSCVPAHLVPWVVTDATEKFVDLSARISDEEFLDRLCDQLQEPCGHFAWALAMGWQVCVTHAMGNGLPNVHVVAGQPREIDEHLLVSPAIGQNPLVPGATAGSWLLDGGDWVLDSEATGFVGAAGDIESKSLDEIIWAMTLGAPDCALNSTVTASSWHSDGATIPPSSLPATPMRAEERPAIEVVIARLRKIADWATENGFSKALTPTRAEVTRYLQDSEHGTVGYYVLEFTDGQCYVGESIDLPGRLDQHRGRYADLQAIRVRPDGHPRGVSDVKRYLRLQERSLIHGAQEAGLYARNVNEMATMIGASKSLDELISPEEQENWLTGPDAANAADGVERRAYSEERLASFSVNFNHFVTRSDADQIVRILGHYLARCVPLPARTEYCSWALSCLTKPERKTERKGGRLSCLTIAMTETLTLFYEGDSTGRGKIQVNDAELFPTEFSEIAFLRRHPSIRIDKADYRESGPGQSFLYAYSLDDLERLLDDVAVTRAAATTALHIMRKGSCMQRKVHSPQLTEAAFRYVPSTAVSSALTH